MPIHYALLARERVVLCDCATTSGTFERVASSILEGLSPTDTKISYESGVHLFHTMVSEGLTYMCVTETLFDRRVAFSFLVELKRQLAVAGLQQKAEYVGPYALRGGFSGVMTRRCCSTTFSRWASPRRAAGRWRTSSSVTRAGNCRMYYACKMYIHNC